MKRISIFVFGILLSVFFGLGLSAQGQAFQPLPMDSTIRYGKLPNGLTYIVRKNAEPKERAEFYIAQRVGSILEEDAQSGLAHFLEHMAFNGTTHFPGKNLISYLESIGVKFGANLNAFTGFDQTVYTMMNVPTTREGIIDSCILILHDWSHDLSLEDKEIDEERGVIHEEWRTRQNAMMRMFEKVMPIVFKDSKYAKRMPIGSMEVVDNFKYQELKDYYHKWYRPDLQGIIIVGDFDPDLVVEKIKKTFADIPTPQNAAERVYFSVPENDSTLVAIASDPEASSTLVQLDIKEEKPDEEIRGTAIGFMFDYMRNVFQIMMNKRFKEMIRKPNAPFIQASASYDSYQGIAQTMDACSFTAVAKEGKYDEALKALTNEMERVRQFGFTATEYDEARKLILKEYETAYNEREKTHNSKLATQYYTYFLEGGYIPGIETEYLMATQIFPQIPVQHINGFLKEAIPENGKNFVITIMGPEKEGITYPSAQEVVAAFEGYRKEKVEAYKEEAITEPLLKTQPTAGKIVKETKLDAFGATELTLSNGVHVIYKPTDFKADEIRMQTESFGGFALQPKEDMQQYYFTSSSLDIGGAGNYSKSILDRYITGKNVRLYRSIEYNMEHFRGSMSPKDMETFFELVYAFMTEPRKDVEAFEAYKQRRKSEVEAIQNNPQIALQDTLIQKIYNNHPAMRMVKLSDFDNINYDRIFEIQKERFANAADFTFIFVGNIDPKTFYPMVEKYIASLPTNEKKEAYGEERIITPIADKSETFFSRNLGTPKATSINHYFSRVDYTLRNKIIASILNQVLDQTYTASVREKEGGTYGVSANVGFENYPKGFVELFTMFDSDPDRADELNKIVKTELEGIANEGPKEEYFNKSVENLIKQFGENEHKNNYWSNVLFTSSMYGLDIHTNYLETLKSIKIEEVKALAKKIIDENNHKEIIMKSIEREKGEKK